MATSLFLWMQGQDAYRDTADWFRVEFPPIGNIEDLFFGIQIVMDDLENGTLDQKCLRAIMMNKRRELIDGLRAWFSEIRNAEATAYRQFATGIVEPGDCIITFNYDVSLDRELHRAGKWEVGDGYGFVIDRLSANSPTTLLKLHGSTNWLAILFGGATSGFFQFQGSSLGERPAIGSAEIGFLGYEGLSDPLFPRPSAAVSPMILPCRLVVSNSSSTRALVGNGRVSGTAFGNRHDNTC
jgi:hypothetical protein